MAKAATPDAPIDGATALAGTPPTAATVPAANGTSPANGNGTRRPKPNRVEISGVVRTKPELRYTTKGGWPIADIVVATPEQPSQDVPFVAWHEMAEWADENLVAGTAVRVLGRVVIRTYVADDQSERKYIELRADHIFPTNLQPVATEPVDVDPFAEA